MTIPVSGLEIPLYLPPLMTCFIATLCAPSGVTGAFLVLPLQVSVLGFAAPAVTPTNLLYNLIGIPGGAWRYLREGRLDLTLTAVITVGLVPGVFVGMLVRLFWLPDAERFKLFVAAVLIYLAVSLFRSLLRTGPKAAQRDRQAESAPPRGAAVVTVSRSWARVINRLGEHEYSYHPLWVSGIAAAIGVVGGAYGIGGGALMSPILLSAFRLPVYGIAGATLLSSFAASAVGILYFTLLGPVFAGPDVAVRPFWLLGLLLGLGGLAGTYLGARLQRHLPSTLIKTVLALLLVLVSARYVLAFVL